MSARAGENRPLLAITLMFGATFAFVAMQAVVKVARLRGFAASEVMFYRTAPGLPLLWWILRRRGQGLSTRSAPASGPPARTPAPGPSTTSASAP